QNSHAMSVFHANNDVKRLGSAVATMMGCRLPVAGSMPRTIYSAGESMDQGRVYVPYPHLYCQVIEPAYHPPASQQLSGRCGFNCRQMRRQSITRLAYDQVRHIHYCTSISCTRACCCRNGQLLPAESAFGIGVINRF